MRITEWRRPVSRLGTASALAAALAASVLGNGCDDDARSPGAPIPPSAVGAVPGRATGATRIELVASEPAPGSTVAGCGSDASGCAGRIRMSFRLTPTRTGWVLWSVGFLHAADKTACLQGRTDALTLRAGEPQTIEVLFDVAGPRERCGTPLEITDLALTVEGTVEVAARQEWGVHYRLLP